MNPPESFAADVTRAAARGDRGTLALYADEAGAMPWCAAGAQLVAKAMASLSAAEAPGHVLLFTGHMVDAPNRAQPRFPRTAAAEAAARRLIADAVQARLAPGERALGIAGGACGGDILFHEACRAAGIPTQLRLALPPEQFERTSVAHAGPDWVDRFRALCATTPPAVLQSSEAPPSWLADAPGFDLWQRNNRWLLCSALAAGAPRRALIALYNPDLDADGPGGTAHLLGEARRRGLEPVALDARELLRASDPPER